MIPVWNPKFTDLEKSLLADCIDSGWVSSGGPYVSKFEKLVSRYIGADEGVAVSSGTAALETAMHAAGLKPGDEIVMPNFTIISNAVAALRIGLKPVFADAVPETWNIDLNQAESLVSERTKAIMVVHIFGLPVNMSAVSKIAKKHRLIVIEDCAESMGATFNGKQTGSFGDLSVLSFFANKSVTSGEGGMVLGSTPALLSRARKYRNLYFGDGDMKFIHEERGFNFRLSNLQAAVGCGQMTRIEEIIKKQREIAEVYTYNLKDINCVNLPFNGGSFYNSYWVYGILLKPEAGVSAHKLINILKSHGVESRPFFTGMHAQPCLKNSGCLFMNEYPVSDTLAARGLYLPSGVGLTYENQKRVIETLKRVLPDA